MDNEFEIQMLDERLHVLEAMQLAQRRSHDLVRLMAESTAEQAHQRLRAEWGLDAGQAHAVLDLQVRRFSLDGAARLANEVRSLNVDRERMLRGEPID